MRRGAVALVLATGVLVAAAGAGTVLAPAGAQQSKDDRIEELRGAIGEASRAEVTALAELADIRARRAELDAAVAELDQRVVAAEREVVDRQRQVDELTAAALDLDARATETGQRLGAAESRASEAAAALYRNESGVPLPSDVLAADELRDIYVGGIYLSRVSDQRRAAVIELADLKAQIEALEREAQARRDEADAARRAAEAQREELGGLRREQQRRRDAVRQEEAREQELVASIRERKDEFTAELATLQVSSNAITDMLRGRQSGQTRERGYDLPVRPVPGGIASPFGVRVHPILGTTRMHNGIDMDAGHGAPIRAADDGTVVFSGVRNGYGNTVIVDHGNQYATLYAHASSLSVDAGDAVAAGDTVALVGATGLATGPHLHFEVRLLGAPVDPVAFL